VLLFDFRAHGDSEGRKCSLGYLERRDLLAALSLLRQREGVDAERVGVYGFSLGGAVAILTAAEHLEIRAVVSDSSFSSMEEEAIHALTRVYHLPKFPFLWLGKTAYQLLFGFGFEKISPMAAIARLSGRPVLLIAGVGDETIPDAHAGYLYEAAGQPKELWLIQGAVHGGTLAAAGPEYQKKVEEFFSQALKMEEEKRDRYPPRSPVLNARRPENWRQRLEGGGQGPEPGGRAPGGGGRYAGRGGHKTGGGGLSGK
jgi:pimeloyl-ACP methyl ester carboxylesterase